MDNQSNGAAPINSNTSTPNPLQPSTSATLEPTSTPTTSVPTTAPEPIMPTEPTPVPAPTAPASASTPATPPAPTQNPGNFTNPATPTNTATGDVILEAGKKKRKKGLIAALIIILVLALCGSGVVAAYIIANQPQNIAMSAIGNLLSAKKVGVNGKISLSIPASSNTISLSSADINFNEQVSDSGNTTSARLELGLSNGTKLPTIDILQVMMSDGIIYLKVDGIKDFYDDYFQGQARDTLVYALGYQYKNQYVNECLNIATTTQESDQCYAIYDNDLSPQLQASLNSAVDNISAQINNIIEPLDGQWVKVAINDIMDHKLLSSFASSARQQITESYNCTVDKVNHFTNYSGELSTLYSQNPFITMTPAQDSFYDISLDAAKTAGFINSVPSTQLVSDVATCFNATISSASLNVTTDQVQSIINYLPKVSAKFDGVFSHRLTDLKINQENSSYKLNADLKFSYPDNSTVTAPTDSRPVMEVVEEVVNLVNSTQSTSTI